jgi:hypothetical protein
MRTQLTEMNMIKNIKSLATTMLIAGATMAATQGFAKDTNTYYNVIQDLQINLTVYTNASINAAGTIQSGGSATKITSKDIVAQLSTNTNAKLVLWTTATNGGNTNGSIVAIQSGKAKALVFTPTTNLSMTEVTNVITRATGANLGKTNAVYTTKDVLALVGFTVNITNYANLELVGLAKAASQYDVAKSKTIGTNSIQITEYTAAVVGDGTVANAVPTVAEGTVSVGAPQNVEQ